MDASTMSAEQSTEQKRKEEKKQQAVVQSIKKVRGQLLLRIRSSQLSRGKPGKGYVETLVAMDMDGNKLILTFNRERRQRQFDVDDVVKMTVEVESREAEQRAVVIPVGREMPTGDEGPEFPT